MPRFVQATRAQSLVEFALVVPLLLILVFGIIDFGMGLSRWIVITNATREGARLGAVGRPPAEVEAKTIAASSGIIDSSNVIVDYQDVGANGYAGDGGDAVVVKVTYEYNFATPLGALLNRSSVTLSACSDMRLERGVMGIVTAGNTC